MKKELLLSLGITMMLLMVPFSVKAQTVYMTDGFENGFNPTCDAGCKTTAWTQKYYDADKGDWVSEAPQFSQPWKTETTGLQYPDGAAIGKGRAYFRNEPDKNGSVQTAGYRTRLITPVMDLSKGYQPILRFYHAQAKYTGDFDTLRVYYRTGEGLSWNLISEYTSPIKNWKFEEISLPAVGEYYQIAFEASENIGRGIVLDSVLVRTRPQITTPHDLAFLDIRDNGVTVQWQASKDADYYEVAVFDDEELDLNVTPDGIKTCFLDSTVDSEIQMLRVENLLSGRNYYVQIRSIGETENSVWCEKISLRIKPVVYLPYTENFNLKKTSEDTEDMQVSSWYWGGDYQPVVHLWISEEFFDNYSPDATPAVSFAGKYSVSSGNFYDGSAIPAGSTSLLVSPEIADKATDFNINQCHVEFYGTVNIATGELAQSIIVGVMTDPEDITTFVPVDTCKVWGYKVFDLFDVSLASYTGNGRYVAFLSHFDKINLFHIDDVTIAKRPTVGRVQRASMHVIPTTTTAVLSWDAIAGATQYNVKYTRLANKGVAIPVFADKMENVTAVTSATNSITLTGLEEQSKYAVSVQAAGGEWSQPKEFQTSAAMKLPTTFHFEEDEGVYTMENKPSVYYPSKWMLYSNSGEERNDEVTIPALYSNFSSIEYAKDGKYGIGLKKTIGADAYIVAPMVSEVDIKNVEVTFYSKTGAINPGPRLQVGVMTDPTDLSTFVQIDEFVSQPSYQRNYVSFSKYNGTGKYIAVRWAEVGDGLTLSDNYIDAFTIRELGACPPVSNLTINATATTAAITWDKGESAAWKLKINSTPLYEAEYDTKAGDIANEETLTTNSYNVSNLKFARSYYVYVQALCEGETTSEWVLKSFKTDCPDVLPLPYTEDFDYLDAGNSEPSEVRPDCWTPSWFGTPSANAYRYGCLTGGNSHSPKNSYALEASTSLGGYGTFVAMPLLDTPLEDVKVTYYAKAGYEGNILYVGVMTDPNDAYTFVKVDSAKVVSGSEAKFEEFSATFTDYTGTGKYIAFGIYPINGGEVYLDDVSVFDVTDRAPFKFALKETTPNSMTVTWQGKTSEKWDVIVSTKYYELTNTFDPTTILEADRVATARVATKEYAIAEGLTAMTTYYFYVKSTKGTEWAMDYFMTECERWNPRNAKTEDFESYGKTVVYSLGSRESNPRDYFKNAIVPLCWTVGNGQYGTDLSQADTNTKRKYFPYVCTNGRSSESRYAEKAPLNQQFAADGLNSLKLEHSSATAPVWAAMNRLDCSDEDLKQLIITGNVQGKSSAALIVGVMDDPEDLSTFVVLDSVKGLVGTGANGGNKAIAFEVPMQNYQGKGRYIAFRTPIIRTSSGGIYAQTLYLDNINVSLASCAAPKVTFSRITDTSARVYSGLRIDNAWKYYLSDKPFDITKMDEGVMPEDSIEAKIVGDGLEQVTYAPLTNLKPKTTYYVAVATICDGKMSAWKTNSFKTLTPDVSILDFHDGFSQYDETKENAKQLGDYWVIGNIKEGADADYIPAATMTTFDGELDYMLQLFSHKEDGATSYAITHGLTFPEGKNISNYQLHCRVVPSSDATEYEFITSRDYSLIVGITDDPSDWNAVARIDTVHFNAAENTTCIVPFDSYKGTDGKGAGGKYVVLINEPLGRTNGHIFVDTLYFEEIPSCQVAHSLSIDNVTKNSFALSWEGLADKYNVAISTEQYSDEEKEAKIATSENIIKRTVNGKRTVFTDLKPNARYYAYVQSLCSDTEKSAWAYGTAFVTTDCDEMMRIPFSDNFDEYYDYGGLPPCYYGRYTNPKSPYYYPELKAGDGRSGEGYVILYGNKSDNYATVFATPTIDIDDLSPLQIAFAARKSSSIAEGSVIIGLVEDLDSISKMTNIDSLTYYTFYPLDTCTATSDKEWTSFFLNLNDAKYAQAPLKQYKHIAFVSKIITGEKSYATIHIDDLKIRPIPTCYEPLGFSADNVAYSTADIHITPYSETDTKWQARVTNMTTKVSHIVDITTPDTFTLTGLDHSTLYGVEVRTDCGDVQSDWIGSVTFNTKYVIEGYYTFTFRKDEQGTKSIPVAESSSNLIHPALTVTASGGGNASSYPFIVPNTSLITYSMDPVGNPTSYALKMSTPTYATSKVDSSTVILPLILNPNDKQISFYMRSGTAYTSNYYNTRVDYISLRNTVTYETSPKATISVGVVDSAQGISTFQLIEKYKPGEMVYFTRYHNDGTYTNYADVLTKASNYGWEKVVIPLSKLDIAGKQVALMLEGCDKAWLFVDSLAIEPAEGYMTPTIKAADVRDTCITLHWNATGAAAYNVYAIDSTKIINDTVFIPYIQDIQNAEPQAIISVKGVKGTSCTVNGLQPGITYSFYVEDAAHAGEWGALSPRRFIATAACEVANGNGYHYGFEPGPNYRNGGSPALSTPDGFTFRFPRSTTATDTVYKIPDCWTLGNSFITYDPTSTGYKNAHPNMILNTADYRYSLSGDGALKLEVPQPSQYNNYTEAYAITPLLDVDMDTAEVVFYGRCYYEKTDDAKPSSMFYLAGNSGNYSQKVAVGTVSNPADISTYVPIDTVEYDYDVNDIKANTVAVDDSFGIRYFQKFAVPLKAAKGQYIVFRQVGYGSIYLDDITVQKRQTPRKPRNLTTLEIDTTSAIVSWKAMEQGGTFTIQYMENASVKDWKSGNVKTISGITGSTYEITGLDINKEYVWRVRQDNSDMGTTIFAHHQLFRTNCLPLNPNGYTTGFECNDSDPAYTFYSNAYNEFKQNDCWSYLNHGTSTDMGSSWAYNIPTTNKCITYSHSGSYGLKLYHNSNNMYQTVAVTPLIDAELETPGVGFDTLQVSFWACPVPHGNESHKSYKNMTSTKSSDKEAKMVEVGTCTDPDDASTYTVLATCIYQCTDNILPQKSPASADNDYAFQKFTVRLDKATGPYVFFRANKNRILENGTECTTSTMYLDDICFETLLRCDPVLDATISDLTNNSATLSWQNNGGHHFDVQVSTDVTFLDKTKMILDSTNVTGSSIALANLDVNTKYFYRIKSYCNETGGLYSDWTQTATFTTARVPMYNDNFTTTNVKEPGSAYGWTTMTGYAKDIFAGGKLTENTGTGANNNWYRIQNNVIRGMAYRVALYNGYTYSYTYGLKDEPDNHQTEEEYAKFWLITPQIAIEKSGAQLVFDAALSTSEYSTSIKGRNIREHERWNTGWDDQFMVIVSDDAGQTWKRENATIWNNETTNDATNAFYRYGIGDYVLTDMSYAPQQICLDLSKYAGKQIKVAFYGENSYQNADYAVHIDNVHINYLVKKTEDLGSMCQFEDIDSSIDTLGFSVDGDTAHVGAQHYRRMVLSLDSEISDTLYTMDVEYREAPVYNYEITVCEGTPFEYMGFNEHSTPGTYRMKLQSKVTGCDSIVNFTIRHTPKFETFIDTTICENTSIMFHGEKISKPGTYTATLQAMGGCDSIITLTLTTKNAPRYIDYVSICQGVSYTYGGKTYTQSGTYGDTVRLANGCDSIKALVLTVYEPVKVNIDTTICEGKSIVIKNDTILKTSGTYVRTTQSLVTGCDSITTWTLHVTPAAVNKIDATICEGDTYWFGAKGLTAAGIYRDTVIPDNGCMYINELTLSTNPITRTSLGTKYINKGDKYEFFGDTLTATGSYEHTLQSAVTGCDSIVSVNLVVLAEFTGHEAMTVCANELPVVWKGKTITAEGVHQFDTLTTVGTDSIVLLSLHVIEPVTKDIRESICEGGKYIFGDTTLTTEGTYSRTTTSLVTSCDSVITLFLTITPAKVTMLRDTICEGENYTYNGETLTKAGIYRDTTTTEEGCMTITELTLTVNPTLSRTVRESICVGSSFLFGDQELTEEGTYIRTDKSAITGCDSTTTLHLTVLQVTSESIQRQICKGSFYDLNGRKLTEAGTYLDTIRYAQGCDSLITELHLVVIEPTAGELSVNICQGGEYVFGDTTLTTEGNYTRTILNHAGCDSVITLHLTVNESLRGTKFASFTKGCSYTYNGITYDKPGKYEVATLKTENGCDSIITLVLTEAEQGRDTIWAEVCAGQYYVDEYFNTNVVGTHEVEIPQESGCTIIRTLILTNTNNTIAQEASICPGDTYEFYGQALTASGTYSETLKGQGDECDTLVTLTLHVLSGDTLYVKDTTTTAQLPYMYNGEVILPIETPEGVYTDAIEVKSESGKCSQIVVLTITVRQPDAVDNIGYNSLQIRPNAVSRGETVYIDNDFSASERAEMNVEMFDMLGHRMEVRIPETGAITISDFPSAGVYTVRISTGEQTYIGRIVVKN